MPFINYTIIKFSVVLTAGILLAHHSPALNFSFLTLLIPLVVLLTAIWLISRNLLFQPSLYGWVVYLCFFCIGYYNYQIRLPEFQQSHYSNDFLASQDLQILDVKILEVLKPDAYHSKYIVQLIAIDGEKKHGKLLLNIKKDAPITFSNVDDRLLVFASLQQIARPLNPHQFNYKKYMQRQGVYHQIKVSKNDILKSSQGTRTIRGYAEGIRSHLIRKLKETPLGKNERAVLQALVLGEKRDIDKELSNDYAAAGAIHILAVSGLHVGIVYLLFSFLMKPLRHLRYGVYMELALSMLILWAFALITGLSPSVTRAVTMFSFFAFAKTMDRKTNTINTLVLSYFALVLVNPLWIFHVGFQLSYLAVLSILLLHPLMSKFYWPKHKPLQLLWNILIVSLAAQLGIVPLSLYYFHQFPGLFFITNLVILPFLGILLGIGILLVVLTAYNLLPPWLAAVYNRLLHWLNSFIEWVANQKGFIIENVHFSELKVLGSYLFLITFIVAWRRMTYKKTMAALLCLALLVGIFIKEKSNASEAALIVFHKNRQSLIGFKQDQHLQLFRSDTTQRTNSFPIKGYRTAQMISHVSEANIPHAFRYKNTTFIVVDSLGIYPKMAHKNVVILRESPKLNLTRLIDSLQPELIVADGSNYLSYVRRWEATCATKKLPFHHTGSKGALIIE